MVEVRLSSQATPTTDSDITVLNPLPIGVHRIQLVVEDSLGNQSDPIVAQVTILKPLIVVGPGPGPVGPGPVLPGPNPLT